MSKDVIIGAIVGLGLLTGTVATAGVINNNQVNNSYVTESKKASVTKKSDPVIETKTEAQELSIPFETKYYDDATLAKGSTKVVQEGQSGTKIVEYEVTYTDGKKTRQKVVSEKVTRNPVDKIVANGTYVKPQAQVRYCANGTYVNTYGNTVCRPSTTNTGGATAICRDGTYSYSQSRRGTCSHHGGVRTWL